MVVFRIPPKKVYNSLGLCLNRVNNEDGGTILDIISSFFIVDVEEVFAPLNIEQRVEIVKICH